MQQTFHLTYQSMCSDHSITTISSHQNMEFLRYSRKSNFHIILGLAFMLIKRMAKSNKVKKKVRTMLAALTK